MVKVYGYARVSSKEQNLARQIKMLLEHGVDARDIVTDKASGKDLQRAGYTALKDTLLRDGDTLIITSLDRLSRNKAHIKHELDYYKAHHIRIKVIDLPTTMADLPSGQEWVFDMVNNVLIEVLASIAEQERQTIRQRQAEGIAAAKERGMHLGRPRATYPDTWQDIYTQWQAGDITAKTAMDTLGLRRTTFYKLVAQYKGERGQ